MCYSVYSSLKTTFIAVCSISYLLYSGIPEFQWIALSLVGWALMQFSELLLWLTKPKKSCTIWNKIITLTLVPIALLLQPMGSLWGALYIVSWKKMPQFKKNCMILYSLIVLCCEIITFLYKTNKCTIVTPKGRLYWSPVEYTMYRSSEYFDYIYMIWPILIVLPFILFWNKGNLLPILLFTPFIIGWIYGLYTDGKPSIWCYYTYYTSITGSILLFLQQTKIYKFI